MSWRQRSPPTELMSKPRRGSLGLRVLALVILASRVLRALVPLLPAQLTKAPAKVLLANLLVCMNAAYP